MNIGVFGGTFDPPHIAHLILAAEAQRQLALDRLLFVLTADPPHKRGQPITPIADRLAMLEAALQDEPAFEISRVEMDRPGPHYAVDTLALLQAQYPAACLIYLLGGDSLRDLPSWHRPRDFLAACCALGVMRRPSDQIDGNALESALPGLSAKLRFVDAPLIDIASHDIRSRIASNRPYRFFLPPAVYQIIKSRRLYRGS